MKTNSFRFAGAVALLSLLPVAAQGEGLPPRQAGPIDINTLTSAPLRLARVVELDAAPKDVFAHISENANWVAWSPVIAAVSGEQDRRTFTLTNGAELSENIVAFEEPSVFAWSIAPGNPIGLQEHLGVMHVAADEEDGEGSILTISTYYNHADPAAILPVMTGGSAGLADGILRALGGSVQQVQSGGDTITFTTVRTINAPVTEVWRVVADEFGEVAKWASVISENTFFGGDSEHDDLLGASRTCFIPGFGATVEERVIQYDEEAGIFAYEVLAGLPPFASNGRNTWTMEAAADGATTVTSLTTMTVAPGTPPIAVDQTLSAFGHVLQISMDELAHYVETGEPHPRELAAR